MFDNLKMVKLVTGEEMIGEVVWYGNSDDGEWITIKHPTAVHLVPMQNGQANVMMHPMLHFADATTVSLDIDADKVLYSYAPSTDIVEKFKKIYSKLYIPENKLIIP